MKKLVILPLLCLFLLQSVCLAADGDEWRKTDMDGVEIWYQDHNPAAKTALVFIHGWSCDSSFWRYQIPAYNKNWRVIAIDLPGFGRSGKPQDAVYSMDFFAKAVKRVLDDSGAASPVLIGHSMGYAVIRQYLTDYPGTVRAVCNVDGAYFRIPEDPRALEAMKAEMAKIVAGMTGPNRSEAVRQFIASTFYGKTPPELQKEIEAVMAAADPHAANSSLMEMFKMDQWEHRSFDVPALSLYARNPHLPPDEEACQRAAFPKLTFALWDDCGHYLMLEKPARFNTALRNFIRDLE